MSPDERGENLTYEGYEFPSDQEREGIGYRLHPPPYSKDKQFALLAGETPGESLWEAMTLYCEAKRDRLGELFTITQSEYLQWARSQPIEHFVRTGSASSDGYYLLNQGATWNLFFEERGCVVTCNQFASISDAKEHVIRHLSPMGVFHQLSDRHEQFEQCNSEIGVLKRLWSSLLHKPKQ